jgi:hypothetical protein
MAGLMGLLTGLILVPDDIRFAGLVALDAAGGRLAVLPLANRRRRSSP